MSSATSIRRRPGLQTRRDEAGPKTRPAAERHDPPTDADATVDPGFRIWHFFVLMSLVAATVAVIMSRQNTPEHLILISLAVGAAGAAAYAFYRTLAPLALSDALGNEPIGDRLRADLEREKMLVLRSIKELEFDRAMGKLSAEDFDEMAGRLRSRAIGLMKQLEGGGYRAVIERDLAERMKSSSRPERHPGRAATGEPSASEQSPDSAAPDRTAIAAAVCACGVPYDADAKFCKACGARVS